MLDQALPTTIQQQEIENLHFPYTCACDTFKQRSKNEKGERSKSSNMKGRKPNNHFLSEKTLLPPHLTTSITTAPPFLHQRKPANRARALEIQPPLHALAVKLMHTRQHRRPRPALEAR